MSALQTHLRNAWVSDLAIDRSQACLYAFPTARLEKAFGELKYVVTGIQLREDLLESHLMGQDMAEVILYPRIKEIAFDKEAVSPNVLEGMETPVWKVVEESQELVSLSEVGRCSTFEDCKMLGSPELTSDISTPLNSITANPDGGELYRCQSLICCWLGLLRLGRRHN